MGALHQGHASLLARARADCRTVVLSIFVNPTQFGPGEDLTKYPRQEASDLQLAESIGADIAFIPTVEEMYRRDDVVVRVSGPSQLWEGASRPGHFDGVATIVSKLFLAVGPCLAYFGLKDLQQCAVVRALVEGLGFPVQLVLCETVREPSGLALSSRNAYLSDQDRLDAAELFRVLCATAKCLRLNDGRNKIDICLQDSEIVLKKYGFDLDYFEVVEPNSMKPSEEVHALDRIIVAAKWKGVRLIDNVPVT